MSDQAYIKSLKRDPNDPLSFEINYAPEDGLDDETTMHFLKMGEKTRDIKELHENRLLLIQDLYEEDYDVMLPEGARKLPSYLLSQMLGAVTAKTVFPGITMNCEGRPEEYKQIVSKAMDYCVRKSKLSECLEDNFGGYERMYLFGDSFIRMGYDPETDFPIVFQNTSMNGLFFDPFATDIRNPGGEHDAEECLAIYEYSWDEACARYPGLQEKATTGYIPRIGQDNQYQRNREIEELQQEAMQGKLVQVAHCYNKTQRVYRVIAGKTGAEIMSYKEADYPFVMRDSSGNEEGFLPYLHFKCYTSLRSMYNWGFGHLFYKLAIIKRILQNKGLGQVMWNANPVRMINLPPNKQEGFLSRMDEAILQQTTGRFPIVINELGEKETALGNLTTMSTEQLKQEYFTLTAELDNVVKRFGINLDAFSNSPDKPLGVVEIEQEQQNDFIRERHKKNTSEYIFAVKCIMSALKEFVVEGSPYYDQPIIIDYELEVKDEATGQVMKTQIENITLGMVADELRKYDYMVEVNTMTGAPSSNLMRKTRLRDALQFAPPGSVAQKKIMKELMKINGIAITDADLNPPPMPVAPDGSQPGQSGGQPGQPPSGTSQPIPLPNEQKTELQGA